MDLWWFLDLKILWVFNMICHYEIVGYAAHRTLTVSDTRFLIW
jgi:hypothetical protein